MKLRYLILLSVATTAAYQSHIGNLKYWTKTQVVSDKTKIHHYSMSYKDKEMFTMLIKRNNE